jgi:hypothetical protein
MKIFVLEDSADAKKLFEPLKNDGHEVSIVGNLKDAAELLEYKPGVKNFDKFIFDAALIRERVSHDKKGFITYNDNDGFNGIQFLLNNLDVLEGNAHRPENVAVITAWEKKLNGIRCFIMPDEKTTFTKGTLSKHEEEMLEEKGRTPKIRYSCEGNEYTFSFLDKTSKKILELLRMFITNG